jgi:restriction system protein
MRRDLTMLGTLAVAAAVLLGLGWARSHLLPVIATAAGVLALVVLVGVIARGVRLRRFAATASLDTTDLMTGPQFEQWCANLLQLKGFRSVAVQGGTGDRGVDIVARDGRGNKVVVQCKRSVKKVSSPAMQGFVGSAAIAKADIAVLMTNSYFTNEATAIGRQQRIVLADRLALGRWLRENASPSGL